MNLSPQSTAPKSPSPLARVSTFDSRPPSVQSNFSDSSDFGQDDDAGKKPWSLLRSIIGTTKSRSNSRSSSPSPRRDPKPQPTRSVSGASTPTRSPDRVLQSQEIRETPPYRTFSFRFSLEWVDRRFHSPGNLKLHPPRLPPVAQQILLSHCEHPGPVVATKPEGPTINSSKYAGRALAEWAMVVNEYQNFFERRKNEGVPSDRLVETPTLGVEAFRRPG